MLVIVRLFEPGLALSNPVPALEQCTRDTHRFFFVKYSLLRLTKPPGIPSEKRDEGRSFVKGRDDLRGKERCFLKLAALHSLDGICDAKSVHHQSILMDEGLETHLDLEYDQKDRFRIARPRNVRTIR